MTVTEQTDDPGDDYLGVPEVARLLGIDPRSAARRIEAGVIPAINSGFPGGKKLWRVKRSDIEAFVKNIRNQAYREIP